MAVNKPNILYVDDEKENLEGFEASFFGLYNIFTADSGAKGLEELKKTQFSVVIADQKMPGMTGLEFIQKAQGLNPDIVCIILTAHLDLEAAIQAVNMRSIFRYIMKPWDKNEMKMTLENGIESYNLKIENKKLLSELEKKNKELSSYNAQLEKLVEQKTAELNQKNKELLELNSRKDEFFSSLLSKAKPK